MMTLAHLTTIEYGPFLAVFVLGVLSGIGLAWAVWARRSER